jgi:arginine exporter protein ArgO
MSPDNHDITPPATTKQHQWMEAWNNDYWGRPLHSESSHKSWRPITVWSFRFFKGSNTFCQMMFGFGGRFIGTVVQVVLNLVGIKNSSDTMMELESSSLFESIFQRDELISTSELFIHRFVNVWIHAVLVQLVGVVAQLLFATTTTKTRENTTNNNNHQQKQQQRLQQYTQYTAQILFALHPTHVEAVANIANRPHILALLFNVTIVDPTIPFVAVGMLSVAGLLSSETGIFHYPAIVLMMTAIQYRRELLTLLRIAEEGGEEGVVVKNGSSSSKEEVKNPNIDQQSKSSSASLLMKTFFTLLPRYILLVMTSTSYLLYRYIHGSLKIPDGLIRPAENPFYHKIDNGQWTYQHRIINYSYILSLHIMKSLGVEIIGFSHEYGFDCIPEIRLPIVQQTSSSSWSMDLRVFLPLALVVCFIGLVVWSWYGWNSRQHEDDVKSKKKQPKQPQQYDRMRRMLLLLTFFAWLATLFPIAGFLKVGTFVADRLVVASTFGTCIFAGRLIALCLTAEDDSDEQHRSSLAIHPKTIFKHTVLLYLCTNHLAKQTHNRTSEWMDAFSLMTSSLKTCPRSIKSNLETSKIYSSLVPHMLDLDKALSLIKTAESIDPTYCDVHLQYSYVYFQQEKYIALEKELVEALLCQFTMGQAMTNWNRYWKVMLSNGDSAANERYTKYMERIQREIAKAEKEEAISKAKKDIGRDEILY